jgi:hypothetical protein
VFFFTDAVDSPNRPRLIVSWNDMTPSVVRTGAQLRYRGDPPDMTPWSHAAPQSAAVSTPIAWLKLNQILAGPVFRADEMLLIAAPTTDTKVQRLYGFGWNGNKRWEAALPAAPWKYLHIDEQGRLLAFRNDGQISVFENFGPSGPATVTEFPVAGLKLSTRPAVSAGGIVVFRNETGSLQAQSPFPAFREIWRTPNIGLSSMPILSPRPGDNLIYVMGDQTTGLVVLDAPTGESQLGKPFPEGSKLSGFPAFHPPQSVEGPTHDWVFLSAYSHESGRLEAYNDFTQGHPSGWIDGKDGPISRCVAPPGNGANYCVQNGQLRSFDIEKATGCASNKLPFTKDGKTYELSATSNLIADGNGAIYFWDQEAGLFYGFDRDCKKLFSAALGGSLPQKTDGSEVLELRAGPNGVFYALSAKQLFAVEPLYALDPRQTTVPGALAGNTRFATLGSFALSSEIAPPQDGPVIIAASQSLAFDDFRIGARADVTCSAGKGISFGAGFKVDKGGVLRCGIEAP